MSEATSRAALIKRLKAAGTEPDAKLDLAGLALAFSALKTPRRDLSPAFAHLDLLAQTVTGFGPLRLAGERWRALARVFAHFGYEGDRESYDDIANADLAAVIERRRGLPVALAILWLHVGRAQGWPMAGLGFPGHFLIRVDGSDGGSVIDAFNAKALKMEEIEALARRMVGPETEIAPAWLKPVSNRAVLIRLENNIKSRLLQAGDIKGARASLARMGLVAPDEPMLWHEAALLDLRQGKFRAGLAELRRAAGLVRDPAARHRIEEDIKRAQRQLN